MVRLVLDDHAVALGHVSGLEHAAHGADATRSVEVDVEARSADPLRQVLARRARLADLEEHVADPPPLAEVGSRHVESDGAEVLAQEARRQLAAQLGREVGGVLGGVHVDRGVRTAVGRVDLPVPLESVDGDEHRPLHRSLVDGGVVEEAGTDGMHDADICHPRKLCHTAMLP